MKKLRLGLVLLAVAFALAQAVPVARTNPPVESLVPAPPAALAALRKSCWDCHSNETVWGWHTRIAPISWLVASDVNEGRGEHGRRRRHLRLHGWVRARDGDGLGERERDGEHDEGEAELPLHGRSPGPLATTAPAGSP